MVNGLEEDILLGPIQNNMLFNKIQQLIEQSKFNPNTKIIVPYPSYPNKGLLIPITYITGLDNGDPLVDEEQFGTVLPIVTYKNLDEAIEKANGLEVGLGASVWGEDTEKLEQVAQKMEAATVWINQHEVVHPYVPFGGIKQSGYGVEFGIEGLKAVTAPKILSYKK